MGGNAGFFFKMGESVSLLSKKLVGVGCFCRKVGGNGLFFLENWVRLCFYCRKMGRSGSLLSNSG